MAAPVVDEGVMGRLVGWTNERPEKTTDEGLVEARGPDLDEKP